jgi:hypothetical protein
MKDDEIIYSFGLLYTTLAVAFGLVLLFHLASCAGMRRDWRGAMPRGRTPVAQYVPQDWHRPCGGSYRVAAYSGNPTAAALSVRTAIAKVNDAAGAMLLNWAGYVPCESRIGMTIVRIVPKNGAIVLPPGEGGRAQPVYSQGGKCIDHWIVTVLDDPEVLDATLLHELGHVAGLEHGTKGVMKPYILPTQTPFFSLEEKSMIRALTDTY